MENYSDGGQLWTLHHLSHGPLLASVSSSIKWRPEGQDETPLLFEKFELTSRGYLGLENWSGSSSWKKWGHSRNLRGGLELISQGKKRGKNKKGGGRAGRIEQGQRR